MSYIISVGLSPLLKHTDVFISFKCIEKKNKSEKNFFCFYSCCKITIKKFCCQNKACEKLTHPLYFSSQCTCKPAWKARQAPVRPEELLWAGAARAEGRAYLPWIHQVPVSLQTGDGGESGASGASRGAGRWSQRFEEVHVLTRWLYWPWICWSLLWHIYLKHSKSLWTV